MLPKRARVARSTRSPCQRTEPASGSSTPRMMRIVVVLPAPFGPTKPNSCPGSTVNDSPSSATTSPYRRARSATSSIPKGIAGAAALAPAGAERGGVNRRLLRHRLRLGRLVGHPDADLAVVRLEDVRPVARALHPRR